MEAERITEYVKTGKGFRVLDTSNLTTKEGKFIQAFQTVDLIGDFMRSDVWGRDIVHAPMIESHIVEQYPEIHRLKPWDRDSVYNHAREVGRMMAFLNAASQGEPARIVGALGRVRELMDSRKENAFIKLISEVGLDNKGQPTDSYKLALTKIGRFLSVEDIGYQEKVDAFDDLKEEDQRTIIIYLLQEYGTSLSQMTGNFMQLIMATKMGAQLDLEIFHEIVRRWLPDRMNARQRQAVRDRLSGDVSGWFDYVPFRPILKTEVDPADLDALNEPERKILKTTNALNITHRTRKLEKGEKKVIPIKKDETPEQTTLIPEEGEEEEEEQTEEDESSVFNDADRKAQDDKKEDESVASAKAKLTEARKGVMQRNRDGYGLRNAYEIKHLLTEEEYQAEVLGGRDINPNQINSNSDSGRVMAAMDKGGEEAMPRHHFKSLFAEPGKGKEIDSIAMEAGFLGEQASLDFIAKAKEDSDLRQQREDLQFEEAEQGIYYDTQEERLQGEMEQRDVDNIAHFSLKGQAQDDLGFINLNSRLSTVLGGSEKYRNWLNSGSQIRDLPTVLRKLGVPQDQIRLYMDLANELHGDRNWAENLLDEFLSRYVFDMRVDQREGNFSGEERYEGDFLDEEGVDRDYSDYTVNKGQGQYEEIMFHLPFDVPGQHQGTSFQDSNLAGWIRGRGYRHSESSTFPEHPVPSVPDISVLSGIDEDTVKIDIDEDPSGDLFLKDIFVKPKDRGKGYADEALDRVLRAADFEGKTIRGWADARDEMFPEGVKDYKVGIPQEQLVEWYKRKGFVVDTDRSSPDSPNPIMVRVPQKPPQPTPAITEAPPVAPPAEAAPPAIDINEVTEYKGLPIHRVRGKPHPVHGNVAPISLSRSADGVPEYINVDMPALAESFRNKQWTSPRVSGITPLPEGAFVTFNHWAEFAAEHEFQHTNFPRIKSTESGYVENEEAINRAAAAALGITEKLYPDIPVAAPVDVWPYSPAPSVEEKLEFQSDLFEVNEVQSKLFQDNKSGFGIGSGEFALEEQRPEIDEHLRRDIEIPSDTTKSAVVETQEQAEFLNMLLKGERWASVFTKGIIQDLAKRRFKRVRFPTGDTAARVQGRETVTTALQRLKTERARRINIEAGTLPEGDDVRLDFKNLSDSETKDGDQIHYRYFKEKFPSKVWKRQTIVVMKIKNVDGTFSPYVNRVVEEEVSVEREVVIGAFHRHELKNTRSLEKIDEDLKHFGGVGSKGFNSISSFYHDRIQSILRKDRSDLKEVTDANGNTWFETEITEEDATRAISFSLQAQQPHAPRPYENTPEWMKISGRLDELPFVDYYGSYSMKVLQSYSPQLKFHVDSPAAHLHDVWWNIRNIMEGEIVIGRQYAQRMLAAAGALEAHTAIGFVYEIEGDEYVIYDLDQYKNKKFKEVARYDNLNEAIKDVHSRNKKLRRWRLPKEDRELAEDVMRWASAERENLNVIVEGVEKWTEESLEKAGFVVANEFGDLSADPALVGEKVVWFDVIEDGKTVFSSLRKGEAIEFMQEEPGTNYKFNNRYVPITRPVAEVREKFYGVHGEAEGKRRFTQVLALLDEAMEQRNRINQEMRDIAGPEWISHWEGREKDSVVVSSEYIPHLYIRKDADKEVSIAQFSGREESKRIEQRSFKNYYQAARDKGLEPVTTRADKLVESWFNDVWGAAVTRTMISLGSIMKDVNGAPLWIPQFNEGVVDKNVNKTEYETRIAMSDGFITQATENLLDYINSLRLQAGKSVFIPDRSRRGKTLINDIINKNSEYLDREGYTTMDSKFKSISHWKVKSGTGFGVSGRSGEENILRMLEERPSGHTFFKVVGRFNNWSKNVGLGLSMFHPAALYESLLAIGGFSNIKWNTMYPPRMITQITNARRRAMADPELIRKWAAAGMRVDPSNPNYDQNQIFQDLQSIKDFSSDNKIPGLGKLAGAWEGYNKWMNQWLWSEFFPGVKIYSAELLHSEMKENFADRGIEFSETALRRDIAKLVNDAFGGQNWDQYIWATPRRLQALHLMLFAPDWTTSAFNISGASNLPVIRDLVRENQGDVQKFVQVNKYWPAMAVLVMTGIPQAIQLALYSVAKLMPGDDDEEAVPFLFQNEPGKRGLFETGIGGHIDVTPVLKKLGWVPVLGYEGGVTGKRRVYMRWGKQASEVFEGWATKPWNTLANKSSSAVRTVVEQMTGYNTAGWELGFKGKPLLGLFSGEKGFTDSRIAYVGRKFVPMSILSIMDGRPTTFFAPASRGMSNYSAQTKMAELISTYASQDTWNSLHGSKEHPVNLAALGMDILEAAERNGHDSEFILTAARRQVLAHYYRQFFQAMNENNNGLLEESAHAILRINAGADDVVRSMKGRAERVRRKFGPAEEQRVREVIARVKPRGLPRPTLLTNDQ